jgi:energy-coupling factor transporter transmembrane protein EcfT
MRRPQVSIAGLLLVILVVAIGLAAIRSGSPAWSGAMFSIMAFTMICSLLAVVLTRGPRRVYWSGFATLGWSYLLLIYVPWLFGNVGQFLLAPNLFEMLEQVLHSESGTLMSLGGFRSMALGGFSGATSQVADFSPLVRIGVALEALLWAYLGGWAARYFASGRQA